MSTQWVDYALKGVIAVILSIASYHMKRVDDDLDAVKHEVAKHQVDIQVLNSRQTTVDSRLSRIEDKLDVIILKVNK